MEQEKILPEWLKSFTIIIYNSKSQTLYNSEIQDYSKNIDLIFEKDVIIF